jgi:hypothetical protein
MCNWLVMGRDIILVVGGSYQRATAPSRALPRVLLYGGSMNIKSFAFVLLAAILTTGSSAAKAQDAWINLPDFASLEAKAKDSVNITLGPRMLQSMSMFLGGADPEDAAIKRLLNGIQSIQVRSFEFDADNAYSAADLDAIRKQLSVPGWTALMNVHERDRKQDVDMYTLIRNEQTRGFALIASEPRQFTIINIVGSIKMSDLPELEKHLHLDYLHWPAAAAQL